MMNLNPARSRHTATPGATARPASAWAASPLAQRWVALMQAVQRLWAALAPRERRAIALAGGVVALALLWWVGLAPALRTLKAADAQQLELDRQMQTMMVLRQQAVALQSQAQLSPETARTALDASTRQHLSASTQVLVTGEQAQVNVRQQSGAALAQWLAAARANAHALPVQARLTRTPAGGAQTGSPSGAGGGVPLGGGAIAAGVGGAGVGQAAGPAVGQSAINPTAWDGSFTLRLP